MTANLRPYPEYRDSGLMRLELVELSMASPDIQRFSWRPY